MKNNNKINKIKVNDIRTKLLLFIDEERTLYLKSSNFKINDQNPKEINRKYENNYNVTFNNPTITNFNFKKIGQGLELNDQEENNLIKSTNSISKPVGNLFYSKYIGKEFIECRKMKISSKKLDKKFNIQIDTELSFIETLSHLNNSLNKSPLYTRSVDKTKKRFKFPINYEELFSNSKEKEFRNIQKNFNKLQETVSKLRLTNDLNIHQLENSFDFENSLIKFNSKLGSTGTGNKYFFNNFKHQYDSELFNILEDKLNSDKAKEDQFLKSYNKTNKMETGKQNGLNFRDSAVKKGLKINLNYNNVLSYNKEESLVKSTKNSTSESTFRLKFNEVSSIFKKQETCKNKDRGPFKIRFDLYKSNEQENCLRKDSRESKLDNITEDNLTNTPYSKLYSNAFSYRESSPNYSENEVEIRMSNISNFELNNFHTPKNNERIDFNKNFDNSLLEFKTLSIDKVISNGSHKNFRDNESRNSSVYSKYSNFSKNNSDTISYISECSDDYVAKNL